MSNPNEHVEEFLKYYCKLSTTPEYAVLLKGAWGSGKTWFIKRFCETQEYQLSQSPSLHEPSQRRWMPRCFKNRKDPNKQKNFNKFVYVSLYGISSPEEIDDIFFIQLNPFWSSKPVVLAGKVFKGLLKTTLHIDLNGDSKSDLNLNSQIPGINLSEYLVNLKDRILIFDDLERCSMKIPDLLGYINQFVEHQGHKVILIANEDEILSRGGESEAEESENSLSYRRIKEKLVGKTFKIETDFNEAIKQFISTVEDEGTKKFYEKYTENIKNLFHLSQYENLRHLKQALQDFERIFKGLSEEVKLKEEILVHLLQKFLAFSFEIKHGEIASEDLQDISYFERYIKQKQNESSKFDILYQKYGGVDFGKKILKNEMWISIFDKGIVDKQIIDSSIRNSRYFYGKPDWEKLWNFMWDLTDEEFEELYTQINQEYEQLRFTELEIITHITGIFLQLADEKLIDKTRREVLESGKSCIDKLKRENKLQVPNSLTPERAAREVAGSLRLGGWEGLSYRGKDFPEFNEFIEYIESKVQESTTEQLPKVGEELLENMENNIQEFEANLLIAPQGRSIYHDYPILNQIEPNKFVNCFLNLPPNKQREVSNILSERYKCSEDFKDLRDEYEWLNSIKDLLSDKRKVLEGKLSRFRLQKIIEKLEEAIANLEKATRQTPIPPDTSQTDENIQGYSENGVH